MLLSSNASLGVIHLCAFFKMVNCKFEHRRNGQVFIVASKLSFQTGHPTMLWCRWTKTKEHACISLDEARTSWRTTFCAADSDECIILRWKKYGTSMEPFEINISGHNRLKMMRSSPGGDNEVVTSWRIDSILFCYKVTCTRTSTCPRCCFKSFCSM